MSEYGEQIEQFLLEYQGYVAAPARCHVILSRRATPRPKVLLGELDDNPSTSVTNLIEEVAHDVWVELLDSEGDFDLYEFVPRGLPDGDPTFYRIQWKGGRPFRWPVWERVDPSADPWLERVQSLGLVRATGYTSDAIDAPWVDAVRTRRVAR